MKFKFFKRSSQKSSCPLVQVSALSHPGRVRDNNEDSFILLPDWGVWAIADGMGGHQCGEVASAIGLMALQRSLVAGDNLVHSIQNAHQAIKKQAEQDTTKSGMGTTLVAVQIHGESYRVAWVGDSRAYLWHNGLRQLTRDHSYVQMLLEQGLIDEADVLTHPYKNVITQALGSLDKESVQVETIEEKWKSGANLLLCSDGLSSQLSDSEIAAILATDCCLEQKAGQLLTRVLANTAEDNITLILLALP
ncbi:MAG: serine/threonine-protein phosphatase [Gammaproteobacteria bacterium HGW-Gammaproteobacteria-3]|jgi:protein phosphatase|nr:MAG: serine/threonine-protein phosphatase [Gammaproteobacteria bacterium HGW-Gammaproteobacteria-3]